MQPLISLENKYGNTIWIKTDKISAFGYDKNSDSTKIWTDGDEPFCFPGKHDDEIIAAIHGWEN